MRKSGRDIGATSSGTELDLGLGALLDGCLESPQEKRSATKEAQPEDAQEPPQPEGAAPETSEFETLAGQRNWRELSALCDKRVAAGGDAMATLPDIEARLWWIRAQLELKDVPVDILSAPLDSVSSALAEGTFGPESTALKILAAELLEAVAKEIAQFSHATDLSRTFAERAVKLHPRSRPTSADRESIGTLRIAPPVISSREEKGFDFGHRLGASSQDIRQTADWRRAGFFFLVLVSISILSLAALGFGWFDRLFPAAIGKLELALGNSTPELSLPSAQRTEGLSQLDAIFYDVNRPRPEVQRPILANSDVKSPSRGMGESNRVERNSQVVDTSGPLESDAVRQAIASSASSIPPEFSQNEAKPTAMNPFDGGSVNRVPIVGQPAARNLDAPGFETFPGGKTFAVLTPSEVMPSPSTRGAPLGQVRPGDSVTVEAQEGYWMRIRSKNGRVGYVLSQDLTPY